MTNRFVAQKMVFGLVFLLILTGGVSTQLYAGGQNRAGTSAAPELLIPAGARYLSMGGSPVALATGIEATFWNPAGIDHVSNSANAIFSHRTYIADIAYNYFAVSGKFDFGSVALSLRALDIGDIPVTTESSPDGTGEIFSPTYFVLGLSYSRQLTDRVGIGLTLNTISESFAQVSTSGFAIDAGVQYRDVLSIPGLDVGVTVKNIGPSMTYGGPGLLVNAIAQGANRGTTLYQTEAASFDLPSVIEIGLGYRATTLGERSTLDVSTTFQNNNFAYDEYRIGAEYAYDKTFYVRAGYLVEGGTGSLSPAGSDASPAIFQNYTLGVGVSLMQTTNTDVSLDYALVPVKYFSNNHVIALRVGF